MTLILRERLLAELLEARRSGAPWWRAISLTEIALRDAHDPKTAEELVATAVEGTGLSLQVLKRQMSVFGRTLRISEREEIDPRSILSDSSNSQEVAVRLYERAPREGVAVMKAAAAGALSLSSLRRRLAELSVPSARAPGEGARSSVVRAKAAAMSAVGNALKDSQTTLWGAGATVRRRPRLAYMGGVGYEVVLADGSVGAGIDLVDPGVRTNRDQLAVNLAPSLLLSTFFREFHLLFWLAEADKVCAKAVEVLDWLKADSVGVLAIGPMDMVVPVRRPEGRPVPDRTGRYEDLKRDFGISRNDEDAAD